MHRRAGVKMHHEAGCGWCGRDTLNSAFRFDFVNLLSRPDLACAGRGAQRRGWEERSHAHPGLDPGEHGEPRTFPAASTVAG
jgi:hypothetical protein